MCVCVCADVYTCVWGSVCVAIREYLGESSFLFPLCEFWELNSEHQSRKKVPFTLWTTWNIDPQTSFLKRFQDAHILDIFLNSGLVMKLKYVHAFWGRQPSLKSFLQISLSLSNPGFAGAQILAILVDLVLKKMSTFLFAMFTLFLFISLMLSVEEDRTRMLISESTQQISF